MRARAKTIRYGRMDLSVHYVGVAMLVTLWLLATVAGFTLGGFLDTVLLVGLLLLGIDFLRHRRGRGRKAPRLF